MFSKGCLIARIRWRNRRLSGALAWIAGTMMKVGSGTVRDQRDEGRRLMVKEGRKGVRVDKEKDESGCVWRTVRGFRCFDRHSSAAKFVSTIIDPEIENDFQALRWLSDQRSGAQSGSTKEMRWEDGRSSLKAFTSDATRCETKRDKEAGGRLDVRLVCGETA